MSLTKKVKSFIERKLGCLPGVTEIMNLDCIVFEEYLRKELYENDRYADPRKLNRFEYQVFSQHYEDGIIDEIFKRIGTTNRSFVEFGAGDGVENNSVHLLLKDWTGHWMEGSRDHVKSIGRKFRQPISEKKLSIRQAFITAENIEGLLDEMNLPEEFDLLSIDLDGNDYWVWKAIKKYRPRVVIVEYNPLFRPDTKWVMKYNPMHLWDRTTYYGASLKSLELLGDEKGYSLVGCEFSGTNAFFVREGLVDDKFQEPFTAENHYEPTRPYYAKRIGHKRDFGDFESI